MIVNTGMKSSKSFLVVFTFTVCYFVYAITCLPESVVVIKEYSYEERVSSPKQKLEVSNTDHALPQVNRENLFTHNDFDFKKTFVENRFKKLVPCLQFFKKGSSAAAVEESDKKRTQLSRFTYGDLGDSMICAENMLKHGIKNSCVVFLPSQFPEGLPDSSYTCFDFSLVGDQKGLCRSEFSGRSIFNANDDLIKMSHGGSSFINYKILQTAYNLYVGLKSEIKCDSNPNDLYVRLRTGEDVFRINEDVTSSSGQPPLSYYLTLFSLFGWDKIKIITGPGPNQNLNPVEQALKVMTRFGIFGNKVEFHHLERITDVAQTMMCAQNLSPAKDNLSTLWRYSSSVKRYMSIYECSIDLCLKGTDQYHIVYNPENELSTSYSPDDEWEYTEKQIIEMIGYDNLNTRRCKCDF